MGVLYSPCDVEILLLLVILNTFFIHSLVTPLARSENYGLKHRMSPKTNSDLAVIDPHTHTTQCDQKFVAKKTITTLLTVSDTELYNSNTNTT